MPRDGSSRAADDHAASEPAGHARDGTPVGMPVPPELQREALVRLLGGGTSVPDATVQNFLEQAPTFGIDLTLLAAAVSLRKDIHEVRQVCLPVIGAGRTVMLFVSGGVGGGPPEASRDRATAIREAVRLASHGYGAKAHLIQALAQPRERWAAASFEMAGLKRLTDLYYLAKSLQIRESAGEVAAGTPIQPLNDSAWPAGISVRAMDGSPEAERDLRRALEASYEDTLDCPELAGMRTLDDIIAAHRDVGTFDPALWWLVEREGMLEGCVLLNKCPAQSCVELVYVGISPSVRGLGLGRMLLQRAIAASSAHGRELRCAVDARNAPARRLYAALGFRETERRVAYVALTQDVLGKQGNLRASQQP